MNSQHKNTFFYSKKSINCGGRLVSLDKPLVMGILNLTPDSFYDGGKYAAKSAVMKHVAQMTTEGADIIDIGAVSTKPGAKNVSSVEEKKRLLPILKEVKKEFPEAILSVDTWRSEIARMAVDHGVQIINDISAGAFDKKMFKTISELKVPYIIMHIQGTPSTMQKDPAYKNVVTDVIKYFSEKVAGLVQLGVNDIIIDPGFGFGKTIEHNYVLMENLGYLSFFNLPVMVGVSRKSMINRVLGTKPEEALNGTTALNMIALMKGADILRVHDVKEAVETVRIFNKMKGV
jgi:dihydropteroate synthase